jgi:hypothetical protein
MPKKTSDETDDSGQPKRTLGKKGTQRQPPFSGELGTRRLRTEAVIHARKNLEENELVGELEEDLNMASAVPSNKRRSLKVSRSKLTASE